MPAYALEPGDAPVQYTVTSWTDQAGLPSNQIRAMAQDRNGYLGERVQASFDSIASRSSPGR